MSAGRLHQVGPPADVYKTPASAFVANFMGRTNMIEVEVLEKALDGSYYTTRPVLEPQGSLRVAVSGSSETIAAGERWLLGFRPEKARLNGGLANQIRATITKSSYLGSMRLLTVTTAGGTDMSVEYRDEESSPSVGSPITISWGPEDSYMLPLPRDGAK
jgi:ABC-type Fe3+/spermidine/putrescine transport system ATPase subunit